MLCKYPFRKVEKIGSVVTELGPEYGCGRCLHCRISAARVWIHRLLLESRCHEASAFVTLTYDDDHLPDDRQVNDKEMQRFMKRLRYYVDKEVRFFGVGEYGKKDWRPHYHLMLFGLETEVRWCDRREGNFFFSKGDVVERAWTKGFTYCGELNKTTCRYIVGYLTKWLDNHEDFGNRTPEFMRCSLKPGLGADYMKKVAKEMCKWEEHVDIPNRRALVHGQKQMPLGRYLTHFLASELGRLWELENEKVQYLYEEYEANKEIEKRFQEKKGKMNSQRVKHEMFKQRRRYEA